MESGSHGHLEEAEEELPTLPPNLAARLEVRGLLGKGAFSRVLDVVDRQTGRPLALKVLPMGEHARRIERELDVARAIHHPFVVRTLATGILDNQAFLLMERASASLLDILDDDSRLDLAWGALVGACRGVAALHDAGLIHRDIKPANILFVGDQPKVADLGLVRGEGYETITDSGVVVGTPAYMSPEQGRGERVFPASDIFSLGMIAYELLERRLPWESSTFAERMVRSITAGPLVFTRGKELVTPECLKAIEQCLSIHSEARPRDAATLADLFQDGYRPLVVDLLQPNPASSVEDTLATPGIEIRKPEKEGSLPSTPPRRPEPTVPAARPRPSTTARAAGPPPRSLSGSSLALALLAAALFGAGFGGLVGSDAPPPPPEPPPPAPDPVEVRTRQLRADLRDAAGAIRSAPGIGEALALTGVRNPEAARTWSASRQLFARAVADQRLPELIGEANRLPTDPEVMRVLMDLALLEAYFANDRPETTLHEPGRAPGLARAIQRVVHVTGRYQRTVPWRRRATDEGIPGLELLGVGHTDPAKEAKPGRDFVQFDRQLHLVDLGLRPWVVPREAIGNFGWQIGGGSTYAPEDGIPAVELPLEAVSTEDLRLLIQTRGWLLPYPGLLEIVGSEDTVAVPLLSPEILNPWVEDRDSILREVWVSRAVLPRGIRRIRIQVVLPQVVGNLRDWISIDVVHHVLKDPG